MKNFSVLIIISCIISVFGLRSANAGQETKSKESPAISLRLMSSDLDTGMPCPEWAVLDDNGLIHPIKIVPWNISSAVKLPLKESLQIYNFTELQEAVAQKSPENGHILMPKPVFDLRIPLKSNAYLLIVKTDKMAKNGWSGTLFDDSLQGYPGGSRLFLNLTDYPLTIQCNNIRQDLQAHGTWNLNPQASNKENGYKYLVQVFAHLPMHEITLMNQPWAFYPDSRGIIIIFEINGSVRLVTIGDDLSS